MKFTAPASFANFVLAECNNYQAGELYDKLAQQNIYVRFFANLGNKLRITIGKPEENDKLVTALKQIISQ